MDFVFLRREPVWLLLTAWFAMAWIAARAWVQSMTIDEADTFLAWVAPNAPTYWNAAANNQLLNSLLMRLFTSVFGAGPLSIRAPALIGAALFIAASYSLARTIAAGGPVEWPLFVCLVSNPLIMDHLVAARGYSLALGFWMAAIALVARRVQEACSDRNTVNRACAAASLGAALSFCSNFSFAFVNAATLLLVFLWACHRALGEPAPLKRYWEALAYCVLPGLLASAFLAGSVIAAWPRGQFVYGAHSLLETGEGLLRSSLYELNPYFVNPPLLRILEAAGPWILALLGAVCMVRAVYLAFRWAESKRRHECRRGTHECVRHVGVIGLALLAILGLTLGAHWAVFRAFGILLPKDRTAIFFAPLLALVAGAAAAVPSAGRTARVLSVTAAAVFFAAGGYFLCCLRLTYFREWRFDAETNRAYSVLAFYNHRYGLTDVFPNWRYVAALNYYRSLSGQESFPKFESRLPPYSAGHTAYVMFAPDDEGFLRDHGMKIVYRGPLSEIVVAIRPELESPPVAAGSYSGAHQDPISAPYN